MEQDRFKQLPPAIIQNILCLFLIDEAARTSILSKEWMHHWTKIPNLMRISFRLQGMAS
ncbi:putative F-box-like domain superfamily protein [Helianthus annuus]|nr:putative F-box-like domain superfamily protein [Helianthus annuus]